MDCAQGERGAVFSLAIGSECGLETWVVGELGDVRDAPCTLEEEWNSWSTEGTAITLPAVSTERSQDGTLYLGEGF